MAMSRSQSTYSLEEDLVAHLARCLRKGDTPWGHVRITFEFDYIGGRADVLALEQPGELVAFEAKLSKWRDALHQAYRTQCFAHRSYVVLPDDTAKLAVQYEYEFRRRRVGLCAVSKKNGLRVLLDVAGGTPLQPWVAEKAIETLGRPRGERRCQQIRNSSKSQEQSV